jgi:hypothetical protein
MSCSDVLVTFDYEKYPVLNGLRTGYFFIASDGRYVHDITSKILQQKRLSAPFFG